MKQFNRFLPENPLTQNDDFIIYGSNDLDFIKDDLLLSLSQKKLFLLNFFSLKSFDRIPINLFNDHDIYMEFTRQFYEPAPYSKGNFTNGMISYYYDIKNIGRLKKHLYHELVHLFYQKIWEGKYERIIWLDERLAQNLSGEKIY